MSFRFLTLGSVSIVADGKQLSGRSTQRRRLALLALLALARDHGLSRDKLVAYLWPDHDTERARHTLSQAIYAIKREFGEDALITGVDDLRLNPKVIRTDLAEFEDSIAAGELERAVAIYGGAFLDGFFVPDSPGFERWVESERSRLSSAYCRALEALGASATLAGDPQLAIECSRKRTMVDPLDSRAAVAFMSALSAAGDRAGAVRHARVHTALLEQELESGPDPDVAALAGRINAEMAADVKSDVDRTTRSPAPDFSARPDEISTKDVELSTAVGETPLPVSEWSTEKERVTKLPSSAERFPVAVAAATSSPRAHKRTSQFAVGAAAVLVSATIATALVFGRNDQPPPGELRTVIMGTMISSDTILGGAVREALRADLESSLGIRVAPDWQIRETLRLMRLPSDIVVNTDIALQVAEWRGAPLVVSGSVEQLGNGVQIRAQLLNSETREPILTLSERPASADEVIPAVNRMAGRLRARVLGLPRDSARPLPEVTTTSLAAMRNYVLARHAIRRLDHDAAIEFAEAALVHDSSFAVAHYLAGDALWYIDQQRHSDEHMTKAFELSSRLPLRERMIVRARYEHLVRDQPDSSLAYWQLLARSYPGEPLAYEGMWWVYRALARSEEMAAAAESAFSRDSTWLPRYAEARMLGLLARGDSARLMALGDSLPPVAYTDWKRDARLAWHLHSSRWESALAMLDSNAHYQRHHLLLAMGRVADAERELVGVRRFPWRQTLPRALLLQARATLEGGGSKARARALAREALEWLVVADLSPPAYSRLAERVADVGARSGDGALVAGARRLLEEKDAGRGLPSYERALVMVEACAAFEKGDMVSAARLASSARPGMFYGRSIGTIIMLQADALASVGERMRADSLYREVLKPSSFADGDTEVLRLLRRSAARACRSCE